MSEKEIKRLLILEKREVDAEFKEKLLIEVENHPCLYRLNHKDYSNTQYKTAIWESISVRLNTTGNVYFFQYFCVFVCIQYA